MPLCGGLKQWPASLAGAILCSLSLGGCGGPPPPEPAEVSPGPVCPLPLVWREGEERPRRIRLTNGTGTRVSVWLDNCTGHTRLGDVPPGRTFLLGLPDRLIPFADALYLHVYNQAAMSRVGSYAVPVEPQWTLSLEVTEETPTVEMVYGEGTDTGPSLDGLNGFVVSNGKDFSFVARWAGSSAAVLTWQCTQGQGKITLTHGPTPAEVVPVEMDFGGAGGKIQAHWTVYRGSGVMLRAPQDREADILGYARRADSLMVRVGEGEEKLLHTFQMSGFRSASQVLGCFVQEGG